MLYFYETLEKLMNTTQGDDDLARMANIFHFLMNPGRLRVLGYLADCEVAKPISKIAEATRLPDSTASKHVQYLQQINAVYYEAPTPVIDRDKLHLIGGGYRAKQWAQRFFQSAKECIDEPVAESP